MKHVISRSEKISRNTAVFLGIFAGAVALCSFFRRADGIEGYASPVFVLAVLLISRFTDGYVYGLIAAVLGVVCVNYFFTYPYMAVNFSISGYPLTFFSLLVVSIITSTLTSQVKQRDFLKMENEREKIRTDLLRSVSHDIRTPLTSIIGSASTLLEDPTIESQEEKLLLQDIRDESQWLLRMVENLLSVTKIEGSYISKKELWAVEEIMGEVAGKIRKTYPAAPIEVHVPESPLFVPMDPILIEQVLFNLAENSILHGHDISLLQMDVCEKDKNALFTISDDGGGFSDEALEKLKDNPGGLSCYTKRTAAFLFRNATVFTSHRFYMAQMESAHLSLKDVISQLRSERLAHLPDFLADPDLFITDRRRGLVVIPPGL